MKIAIPATKDNNVDAHFGHCEFYQVYSISNDNVIDGIQILEAPCSCGCKSNIAYTLAEMGVKTMLAGGIGDGAVNVLNNAGIQVIKGCSGNIDSLIEDYLNGKIKDTGDICDHNHNHNCSH